MSGPSIGFALPHRSAYPQSDSDFISVQIPYLTRTCFFVLQLFECQAIEAGDLTTRIWAEDLSPSPENEDNPDDDDNIPIPRVKSKGKESDHIPVVRVSDDKEDDDCRILEPIDPMPISWAPASVLGKTDAGAGTSKKRTAESESEAPQASKRSKRVSKKSS